MSRICLGQFTAVKPPGRVLGLGLDIREKGHSSAIDIYHDDHIIRPERISSPRVPWNFRETIMDH